MIKHIVGSGATYFQYSFKYIATQPVETLYLTAFDDNNFNSTEKAIFQGTQSNNNQSLLVAINTSYMEQNWWTKPQKSGGDYINRLKGYESYLILNSQIGYFNITLEIPRDLQPFGDLSFVLKFFSQDELPPILVLCNFDFEPTQKFQYIWNEHTLYMKKYDSLKQSLEPLIIVPYYTTYLYGIYLND